QAEDGIRVGHVTGVQTCALPISPDAGVASVAFLEVVDGWTAPADYAARFGAARLPFDYVWFTARADNADHCARLRERARAPKDVGGPEMAPHTPQRSERPGKAVGAPQSPESD